MLVCEVYFHLRRDLVCLDHSLCPVQRLLRKLLHIRLARRVIRDCLLGIVFSSGLDSSKLDLVRGFTLDGLGTYLFQLVHQVHRVLEQLAIGVLQPLRKNLIDDPVLAWDRSEWMSLRMSDGDDHTPVGYDGLDSLQLRCAAGALGDVDVRMLERQRHLISHGERFTVRSAAEKRLWSKLISIMDT